MKVDKQPEQRSSTPRRVPLGYALLGLMTGTLFYHRYKPDPRDVPHGMARLRMLF